MGLQERDDMGERAIQIRSRLKLIELWPMERGRLDVDRIGGCWEEGGRGDGSMRRMFETKRGGGLESRSRCVYARESGRGSWSGRWADGQKRVECSEARE